MSLHFREIFVVYQHAELLFHGAQRSKSLQRLKYSTTQIHYPDSEPPLNVGCLKEK
jgi:hypothetical protein